MKVTIVSWQHGNEHWEILDVFKPKSAKIENLLKNLYKNNIDAWQNAIRDNNNDLRNEMEEIPNYIDRFTYWNEAMLNNCDNPAYFMFMSIEDYEVLS